jgi:hypothetical protein
MMIVMRSLLFALALAVPLAGCVAQHDDAASGTDALSGCVVRYESASLVVYETAGHTLLYAPKNLHVAELRIKPAVPYEGGDWLASPFARSRLSYTLAARIAPDALGSAMHAVGVSTLAAEPLTIDASSATLTLGITPWKIAYDKGSGGASFVANITDGAANDGSSGPVVGASLRESLVAAATARATGPCGEIMLAAAHPVDFDVAKALVHVPERETTTMEAFVAFSNSVGGILRADLAKYPSAAAKAAAAHDAIEREIRPALVGYESTIDLPDLKGRASRAWAAYADFAQSVLDATGAKVTLDQALVRGNDGTTDLAPSLPGDAIVLLFGSGALRDDVDALLALAKTEWVEEDLHP